MKERTIHFKNGDKKYISQEVIDYLKNRISNGCKQWQSFGDEEGNTFLILNLNEITFID